METLTFYLKSKNQNLFYGESGKNFWPLRISNDIIDIIIDKYYKFSLVTVQSHYRTLPCWFVFIFIAVLFSLLFPFYFLFMVDHSCSVSTAILKCM